jgi:hypothetical protein
MLSVVLAVSLVAAPPVRGLEEEAPLWLTFDVLNPEASGKHSILHLDDLLSSRAGIPDLPAARGILLFATTHDACRPSRGICVELAAIARETKALGGLVIALLLDGAEALPRARKEVPGAHKVFPVIQDTRGIVRHALHLDRPGEIIVINSNGKFVRFSQPSDSEDDAQRKLIEAKKVFYGALRRDKED